MPGPEHQWLALQRDHSPRSLLPPELLLYRVERGRRQIRSDIIIRFRGRRVALHRE